MKVRNLQNEHGRAVASQFVITDEATKRITFQSYNSPIVTIDRAQRIIEVGPDWDYSRTTARHRNAFMTEQGIDEMATTEGFRNALLDGYIYGYKVITT